MAMTGWRRSVALSLKNNKKQKKKTKQKLGYQLPKYFGEIWN